MGYAEAYNGYATQGTRQIDAEIAEKSRFRTGTIYMIGPITRLIE